MTPEVTVIVPVYNTGKRKLNACISSILSQSYGNLIVLLIDDGSTDESGDICDQWAAKDDRVHVTHKENGGVISARNAGIVLLPENGYCCFCDSDDRMPKNSINDMLKYAIDTRADIVCGGLRRFFRKHIYMPLNSPAILAEKRVFTKEEIINSIYPSFFGITNYPGYMPSKLYKNSLLKKALTLPYPPIKFFQEDVAYNLQLSLLADRIAVLPTVVYYYRMGGGTSRYMPSFLDDCVELYRFKKEIIKLYNLDSRFYFTSAIEMKNECASWLKMYFNENRGDKEVVLNEIKRCCCLPEIIEAVNWPEADTSGLSGFKEKMQQRQYDEVYKLIFFSEQSKKLKNQLKRIVIGK